MRAVALLTWWKFRNSLRTLFTDPRKLIPFLIIGVSLGFSFGMMLLVTVLPHPESEVKRLDPGVLHAATMLAMVLVGLTVLNMGLGERLLAFAMPDVDYLFPSPISRRVVLGYRLPSLTWGALMSAGGFIVAYAFLVGGATVYAAPALGHTAAPPGLTFVAAVLCVGTYLNGALFLAIHVRDRERWHHWLTGSILVFVTVVVVVAWKVGVPYAMRIVESPWVRYPLLPSSLAADALYEGATRLPALAPVRWLLVTYLGSLALLLATRANFYEQSIVATERFSTLRNAAKGGFAGLMAARAAQAAQFKRKARRTYTIAPFGKGAMALFWAHLCAAWKRPGSTFVAPVVGGIAVGILGAEANHFVTGVGYGAIAFTAFYASIGFLASAKTASEAAILRRELISPLPIPAWQAVAANLGVPWLVAWLFGVAAATAYVADRGDQARLVAFALVLLFPLRLMGRMTLQYGLVLNYSDLGDKVQQLLSGLVYYMAAAPFAILEGVVCVPGIVLSSPWAALLPVMLLQVPVCAGLLALVGRATARAVASGEPVSLWAMLRRQGSVA